MSISKEVLKQYYLYAGDNQGQEQNNKQELERTCSDPHGEGHDPEQEFEGQGERFE